MYEESFDVICLDHIWENSSTMEAILKAMLCNKAPSKAKQGPEGPVRANKDL